MKKSGIHLFVLVLGIFMLGSPLWGQMNNDTMDRIIRDEAKDVEGSPGGWQMDYGGQLLLIITDQTNNRMRIFTPILEVIKLESDQMEKMLKANFHSALDAKYSIYEEYVVSVYTHPLKELTEEQFIDAMRQVVVLANTFGTTYNSTGMIFDPGGDAEEEEKPLNKKPQKKT